MHVHCRLLNFLVPIHWFLTRKLTIVSRVKANHGEKSWDTFEFLLRFPIHTHLAPPLTPQTTLEACFQIFFSPEFQFCIGWGRENWKKISKRMHCFMVAFPLQFLLRDGGSLYTGYFMRETRNYRRLWILSWILKLWILSRRLLSGIVAAISTTIIFLPPMLASIYFYSFPNPPPPLPHFRCFRSTTTIRNTTYLRKLKSCTSLNINMKKQKRKIKNVVSPALIIQHANTNSDIICFIAKNCSLMFIC